VAYTDVSFTLTKTAYVSAMLLFNAAAPIAIGITGGSQANPKYYALCNVGNDTNAGEVICSAILEPGTYYIYAKSSTASENRINVDAYYLP
jgi:hypothetical protein